MKLYKVKYCKNITGQNRTVQKEAYVTAASLGELEKWAKADGFTILLVDMIADDSGIFEKLITL